MCYKIILFASTMPRTSKLKGPVIYQNHGQTRFQSGQLQQVQKKNIVFPDQAECSYVSVDFRLKTFSCIFSDDSV